MLISSRVAVLTTTTKVCSIAVSSSLTSGATSGLRLVRRRPSISVGMVSRGGVMGGSRMAAPCCIETPTSRVYVSSSSCDCGKAGHGIANAVGKAVCLSTSLIQAPILGLLAISAYASIRASRISGKISSPCSLVCMGGRSLSLGLYRRSRGMTVNAISGFSGRSPSRLLSIMRRGIPTIRHYMPVHFLIVMLGNSVRDTVYIN